ncbi:dienelactone hydrolase family protein [Jannaschia sp. S6380]|uniref:dienelactone hydrolase family protein n=1 Tax=Jannaschia sp. S6380 TaxID=2926408 RepID=UPI001FF1CD3E|nr:dienelactone hydrolase family protein [Jannaschia sp. S6380]MCK0167552.1 dienelactone hydrolase family protein [Jannaschia sp. S6380]
MGERHAYDAGGQGMLGYRARPEAPNGAALLVIPAFAGLRAFEMAQCDRFAAMGYDVLGVDYYGDGWTAADMAEAGAAMGRLNDDRRTLLARTEAALAEIGQAGRKVGAIGFCFGAKAVLDMARAGDLDAAVSLHGIYDAPPFETVAMPPVLLCHGWNDPLATPDDFEKMAAELERHSADWHALCFGGTGHAFTNPDQAGRAPGMGYVEVSARRTWAATEAFLSAHLT